MLINSRTNGFLSFFISLAFIFGPVNLHAQVLEEVVVTAQRREQSLQQVPISLEAISGAELQSEGFRTIDELAEFSPTVEIDIRRQDQDVSIRGIGTVGNSLHLEQGAPIFSDGIHNGRTSMVKGAFLDLERVEILRGPQPVYFGQNATAGAFSLVSKKPGAQWEGDITGEFGNFGRRSVEGGIGGPITDTLGIRVAGKYDRLEGFLTDVITREKFPKRKDVAGRMILQWAPTEQFEATLKIEGADARVGAEGVGVCLGQGSNAPPAFREVQGIDALVKGRTGFDDVYDLKELTACDPNRPFKDALGIKSPEAYFDIPAGISQEDADGTGFLDIREGVRDIRQREYGRDVSGFDELETYNSYLELNYDLMSGVTLTSLTGFVDYTRIYNRNNSNSPFLGNMRSRGEDFSQISQELRATSPVGGAIEWMAGAYWQKNDLDIFSDNYRANLRRPRRLNNSWEDVEWMSAFATVTFNFMDDKASVDLGGRYTDVDKEGYLIGYGARWVFDTPSVDGNSTAAVTTEGTPGFVVDWRESEIPANWHTPIGITPISATIRRTPGPYNDTFKASEFDPQVTLRYRPTENLSTYAKWAQAFKSGGFNTGPGSLPDEDDFTIDPELAENWEIGAKGKFMDGRARADLSLFWMTVSNLQIATTQVETSDDPTDNVGSEITNAGKQRVRGAEFSFDAAITERLTARFSGVLMDGEMVDFKGAGCTDIEFENADSNDCISEDEATALGNEDLEGTIDRSGQPAPRTPDWKFALKLDYWMPLFNRHKATFKSNIVYSDGYITNVEDFDRVQMAGTHLDMNLSAGFGDVDDTWHVSFWARNLFGVQEEYNQEFEIEPDGIITDNLSQSHYRTYGVQLQYNYR